jgi:hypothetical protein
MFYIFTKQNYSQFILYPNPGNWEAHRHTSKASHSARFNKSLIKSRKVSLSKNGMFFNFLIIFAYKKAVYREYTFTVRYDENSL